MSTPNQSSDSFSQSSAEQTPESRDVHGQSSDERSQTGGDAEEIIRFRALPRTKRFIVVTFSLVNFCVGVFYSLLGPFFPTEAARKGVSNTVTGLIFGVFELIFVIMSPVYGNFITQVGAKFMYCSGLLVCGTSGVLFGFLDASPPGIVYIVMCFLVRIMEGLGAAAFLTASFAIMAHTFPDNVATMFGTLEMFSGLGLMAGPPIGGALYQLGGFRLPFVSFGGLLIVIGVTSIILLPTVTDITPTQNRFILGLLRIPVVCIMCLYLVLGAAVIGFIDVGMANYLNKVYKMSPVIIGVIFIVAPAVYAFTAPAWGALADKRPALGKVSLVCGYLMAGASCFFLGPAPFIPIANNHIWLLVTSLAVAGLGIGTLVINFSVLTEGAHGNGYSDNLETFGLISGLFNSFFSLGAFIGPLLGGYFIDKFGFQTASVFFGCSLIIAALVFLAYCAVFRILRVNTSRNGVRSRDKDQIDGVQSEASNLMDDALSNANYSSIEI